MGYTRFLPDSTEALTQWELRVWIIAGIFGVMAIALGFVARGISHHRSGLVQARSDEAIRQRDEIVAAARRDAALAKEGLAKSSEEIARLNSDSGKTAERTATLSRRVEEESQRRAQAEAELVKLRDRLAPRVVTKEQARIISTALAKFKGQSFEMVAVSGSKEVSDFAAALHAAFRDAGLIVALGVGVKAGTPNGLTANMGRNREALASAIGLALMSAKILNEPLLVERSSGADALTIYAWPK